MNTLSLTLLGYSALIAAISLAAIKGLQSIEMRRRKEIEALFKMLELMRARMQPGTYSFYFQNGQLQEPKADRNSKDAKERRVTFQFFDEGKPCDQAEEIPKLFRQQLLEQLPRIFL